jgi:hypothetical protein
MPEFAQLNVSRALVCMPISISPFMRHIDFSSICHGKLTSMKIIQIVHWKENNESTRNKYDPTLVSQ